MRNKIVQPPLYLINGYRKKEQARSIVEVLIVLAIILVAYSVTSPHWLIRTQYQKLVAAHSIANVFRQGANMAMVIGSEVILCPSQDGKHCLAQWNTHPWMLFINTNKNTRLDASEQHIRFMNPPQSVHIHFQLLQQPRFIRWYPTGHINRAFSLGICATSASNQHQANLALIVNLQGRVRRGEDSNNDGNEETASGTQIHC